MDRWWRVGMARRLLSILLSFFLMPFSFAVTPEVVLAEILQAPEDDGFMSFVMTLSEPELPNVGAFKVDICGDLAVTSKPSENGVSGVHTWRRTGAGWTHDATVTPAPDQSLEDFGASGGKSVSLDGDTLSVCANAPGDYRVLVFVRDGEGWRQQAVLPGMSDGIATVEMLGDTLAMGGMDDGLCSVRVYERTDQQWALTDTLYGPINEGQDYSLQAFGFDISLSEDGMAVSGSALLDVSSAYVYVRTPEGWTLEERLDSTSLDYGARVSLSGDRLAVLEYSYFGGVHVYVRGVAGWEEEAFLQSPLVETVGSGMSCIALDGNTLLAECSLKSGLPETQAIVEYSRNETGWHLVRVIPATVGADIHDIALAGRIAVAGDRYGSPLVFSDYAVESGQALEVQAPGVLLNDHGDYENEDRGAILVREPSHGSLFLNLFNGAFTYVPDEGYAGEDSFTYRNVDWVNYDYSALATVHLTVLPGSGQGLVLPDYDRPVAHPDDYCTAAGQTLYDIPLCANDEFYVDGVPQDTHPFLVADPLYGSVTLDSSRACFTYVPDPGFSGIDSFTYRAYGTISYPPEWLQAYSDPATVTIAVTPPAPIHLETLSTYCAPPGAELTLTGTGFGSEQGTSWVKFPGAAAEVVSWSDTQIVARVPAGASPGYVGVVVDGVISNGRYFIPALRPTLSGMSSYSGAPGTEVSFCGTGFGVNQGSGSVTFGGAAGEVVSWSDTEVVARVPADAVAGYAGVWQAGLCSNGLLFSPGGYPTISSLSVSAAPVGVTVYVYGSGFGDVADRLTVGGIEVATASWSDTMVSFVVPEGISAGYVGVWRGSVCSNGKYFTPGVKPVIDSLSTSAAPVGATVYVYGSGFGDVADRLTVGGIEVATASWSDTMVSFVVSEGISAGYVGVWRGSLCSNGKYFTPLSP